jgi:hypothetical protein
MVVARGANSACKFPSVLSSRLMAADADEQSALIHTVAKCAIVVPGIWACELNGDQIACDAFIPCVAPSFIHDRSLQVTASHW